MSVPMTRIRALQKVRCAVFNSVFNPNNLRLGNKVLRQRLRGPSVASYYPPRVGTFRQLKNLYPEEDGYEMYDEAAEQKMDDLKLYVLFFIKFTFGWLLTNGLFRLKLRGKGAPKKKREKSGKAQIKALIFLRTSAKSSRADSRRGPAKKKK